MNTLSTRILFSVGFSQFKQCFCPLLSNKVFEALFFSSPISKVQVRLLKFIRYASCSRDWKNLRYIMEDINKLVKACFRYIFTSLFCMSKREHLWNKEKCFSFHFESSFRSWDNQILYFQIFKRHDVIKCLNMKREIHFTEQLGKQTQLGNEIWPV